MRLTVRLIVLFAAALFVASCSGARAGTPDQWGLDLDADWVRVDDMPLSPRYRSVLMELPDGALVVGGSDDVRCPPNALCGILPRPDLRSGARYHAADSSWTTIADAPRGIGPGVRHAVVGQWAFLWDGADILAYHMLTDTWEIVDKPPVRPVSVFNLHAFGDRLLAAQVRNAEYRGGDWLLDPATQQWEAVPTPPSDLAAGRSLLPYGDRLYLFETIDELAQPTQFRAWVLDGLDGEEWQMLTATEQLRAPSRTIDGVLINPSLETSNGGATNGFGRSYSHGGIYDPTADEWSELPNRPETSGQYRWSAGAISADEQLVTSGYGDWILHWEESTWHKMPKLHPLRTGRANGWVNKSASGWAGDGILVVGGVVWNGDDGELLSDAWIWRPRPVPDADDQG